VGLAVEANASRLILFHHDPSHVDDQIDEMVAAAQAMAGQSPLLVEGARENQILHFGIQSSPKNRAPSAICRENCGLV
jgi:hypothetical protein